MAGMQFVTCVKKQMGKGGERVGGGGEPNPVKQCITKY